MAARSERKPKALSGWHAEDVKAAIRKKGQTLSGLSKAHRYSDSYLRGALIRPLPRGEAIIANFLGLRPQDIWPDRYDSDGMPKTARRRRR